MALAFMRSVSHSDKGEVTVGSGYFSRGTVSTPAEEAGKGGRARQWPGHSSACESWGVAMGSQEATAGHVAYFILEEKENYLLFQWQPITGPSGTASAWKPVAMATSGGIIKNF